jgi:choline dehydrogenase-like flavoprotein
MGGCAMADSSRTAAWSVDDSGRHFQISNLSIHDGSVFPTSIGANPQLSIYGLIAQQCDNARASALTEDQAQAAPR